MFTKILNKILPDDNKKYLKYAYKIVKKINALEPSLKKLSDPDLKQMYLDLDSTSLSDILVESFAISREVISRVYGIRLHDVQLIGAIALQDNKIAEMKTGEGKSVTITLPVILSAKLNKQIHVITVNDYLAERDSSEFKDIYNFFDISISSLTEKDNLLEQGLSPYDSDVVYGTNNEFGFDFLRDNLAQEPDQVLQKGHYFAIIDEIDSVLIDEARTPLVISGEREIDSKDLYYICAQEAKKFIKDIDFKLDDKTKNIHLLDNGIQQIQDLFKIDNLFAVEYAPIAHIFTQSLRAIFTLEKDTDYVIQDNKIVIVDEYTGRLTPGRRFGEGLHQTIEAKEGLDILPESQTIAETSFQNYFRNYSRLSGLTGTAKTEEEEFRIIYGLQVIAVPTNVPVERIDNNDIVFRTKKEVMSSVLEKIIDINTKGQPLLIGTTSIEKSEELSWLLQKHDLKHTVLNAKKHAEESNIIKHAGQVGSITIATNIAGRGVDIKLSDESKLLGGLFILGVERHENRRIDNQLIGRSGRQGDPGESQYYLSLDDNLLSIFGGEKLKSIMTKIGMEDGEEINSPMVSKSILKAQKKIEEMYFDSRKNLIKFDDISNEQRKIIYSFRKKVLLNEIDLSLKLEESFNKIISDFFSNSNFDEFTLIDETLEKSINSFCLEKFNMSGFELKKSSSSLDEIKKDITSVLLSIISNKFSVMSETKSIENIITYLYLMVIDDSWKNHLYSMDLLRTGIHLRSYNQKDPFIEFKRESFSMFNKAILEIKANFALNVLFVQLQEK
jgi:preprotein translocase subunit SecA